MQDQLTLFQADFPASPTAAQESDWEKKMNATYGQKCLEQFERLSQPGLWAKMFAGLLIGMGGWYSMRCSLTWKLKGTKSNRMFFQLLPSTLPTEGTGFGLLPILPTPTTGADQKTQYQQGGGSLMNYMDFHGMLPTPTTRDYKGARSEEALKKAGRNETNSLPDAFHQAGKTSQLNPPFVAEMMGFPTDWTILPFLNGETKASKPMGTQ